MGFRREEAYQKIQAAILSGDLRPGEKLVEKDLRGIPTGEDPAPGSF